MRDVEYLEKLPPDGVRVVPKKDPLQPKRCAELLAALAAPERLKIVRFLADGAQNVTSIAKMLKLVNVVNVSHHLTVLKHAGLIRGDKKGRFVWYSLCPGVLEEAVEAGVPHESLNLGCCKLEIPCDPEGSASGC
jgi:DNA-binding transcriptional ArsR family regulator